MALFYRAALNHWKQRRWKKQLVRTTSEISQPWAPTVRRLEPRIVLNASAELNPLGQLVVFGTEFDDSLRIEFDQNDALQIFDDTDPGNPGQVVPISGHPDGPGGQINSLLANDISSGQVFVLLDSGDDSLSLPLLGSLDVFVVGDQGSDSTTLQLDDSSVSATGSLFAESEQITLSSASNDLSLGQASVQLNGAVRFDSALASPKLQIDNLLSIDGSTTLSVDTTLMGMGRLDLSQSILRADAIDVDLLIAMPGGSIQLGRVNADGGELLNSLTIEPGAETILSGNEVLLENELVVQGSTANVRLESIINASSVTVSGADVTVLRDITSTVSDIQLESSENLFIGSQVELFSSDSRILLSGSDGSLNLGGVTLRSNFSGDAIVLSDFDQVSLGDTFATNGELVLGISGGELGDVNQEASTTLTVDRISSAVSDNVDLSNISNQIRVVTTLVAGGDINVIDSADDLLVQSIVSSSGNVNVMASGALAIGEIQAIGQSVTLNASQIDDASDDGVPDLIASDVTLTANNGIGAQHILELDQTTQLTADSDAGDVSLVFQGDSSVVIRQITTADANVFVRTTGKAADLLINNITVLGDGMVSLDAADDILKFSDAQLVTASRLSLIANNNTGDQTESIDLRTDVDDLAGSISGELRGDLIINNIDDQNVLRLGALANVSGQEITPIQTGNGQIIVRSAVEIEVVDLTVGDGGLDLKDDPEIIARGEFGRVDLEAQIIDLQADVQIHGEKLFQNLTEAALPRPLGELTDAGGNRTDRTIYLTTDNFLVGENVELFTGEEQGTARQFVPRPASGQPTPAMENAFFDPNSVTTNVLTQALQNDATGILTVNVGTTGERGLTVTIDWGDSDPRRFQQIDNIDADENAFVGVNPANGGQPTATNSSSGDGTVQFTHLYLEEDTVNSRSNGRTAATEPYNVRFAVRHHDSIVVESLVEGEAATVSQIGLFANPGQTPLSVAGGLITSTDSPTTTLDSGAGPVLETGTANFIIPNLSIPVAFFPVRDVIPEFEPEVQVVTLVQPTEVLNTTLEVADTPTTSIVSREEFFQLRVLSPDPDGEDLAPPEKLPPEIFDGNRLREMFSQLPDGGYEIEKVIGDGDQRSILRVEVREGEATIPDDELDEGLLKLTPLESVEVIPSELDAKFLNDEISIEAKGDDVESQELEEAIHEMDNDTAYALDTKLLAATGMLVTTGVGWTESKRRIKRFRMNLASDQNRTNQSRLSRGSRLGKRRHG